jgi:signal peptidase II
MRRALMAAGAAVAFINAIVYANRMKRGKKTKGKSLSKTKLTSRRFWPYGILIFVILLLIDQYTKHVILTDFAPGESMNLFWAVKYTLVQNTGTAWGLLSDANSALIWLSIIAFGLLLYFFDKFETVIEKISYTLILVGLWGNLLDRGVHGFVVDFIQIGWWPVFNIADSCITVGVILFLIQQVKKDGAKHR